jgi:hypothetical protein
VHADRHLRVVDLDGEVVDEMTRGVQAVVWRIGSSGGLHPDAAGLTFGAG